MIDVFFIVSFSVYLTVSSSEIKIDGMKMILHIGQIFSHNERRFISTITLQSYISLLSRLTDYDHVVSQET